MYFSDYSIYLAEVILTNDEALEERQMATVLLKNFISTHWNSDSQGSKEPTVKSVVKTKLKSVLPLGLSDTVRKIQIGIASTLATIAKFDYPHNWPEMIPLITSKINSSNENDVYGILIFLNECSRILQESYLTILSPVLHDSLYQICQNEEVRLKKFQLLSMLCKNEGQN